MNLRPLVIGTLVGAVALTATGYVVFGLAFPRFYTDFMKAGSAIGVAREPFLIWPIALAMVSYALLMTVVIAGNAGTLTVLRGMKIGALVSFLLWFTGDFMLYGISNIGNIRGILMDPLLEAVPGAVAGGVVAAVLGLFQERRSHTRRAA